MNSEKCAQARQFKAEKSSVAGLQEKGVIMSVLLSTTGTLRRLKCGPPVSHSPNNPNDGFMSFFLGAEPKV